MHDFFHRAAVTWLFVCGLLTAFASLESINASRSFEASPAAVPMLLVRHWGFMMALLGAGMLLTTVVPALRLPTVGGAALGKIAVFLREAWQEARWIGMLRIRPES